MQSPEEKVHDGRRQISSEIICYGSRLTEMQSCVKSLGVYLYKRLHVLTSFPDIVLPNYVIMFMVYNTMLISDYIMSVVG